VFLTDHYAYKLKKPVRLPPFDARSLAARHRYCGDQPCAGHEMLGAAAKAFSKAAKSWTSTVSARRTPGAQRNVGKAAAAVQAEQQRVAIVRRRTLPPAGFSSRPCA